MLLLIDNFDSFTYNLVTYAEELGAPVTVYRNNAITASAVAAMRPQHIILSPGPCGPTETGVCLELIDLAITEKIPLLGVCLGHQAIGHRLGGRVLRAPVPVHGKIWPITHTNSGIFAGLPSPFMATRYHSLIVERESLPNSLRITATTAEGLIMGLEHVNAPVHGVQFHPESIMTQHGYQLLANFLAIQNPNFDPNQPLIHERNSYLNRLHQPADTR